jgi:hypothetical protein
MRSGCHKVNDVLSGDMMFLMGFMHGFMALCVIGIHVYRWESSMVAYQPIATIMYCGKSIGCSRVEIQA